MTFQKTLPVAGIAVLAASATAEQPLSMIRFASVQTRSTEEWKGTLKAFREHPGCCDDVWFSTGESFPSLDWHRKHLKAARHRRQPSVRGDDWAWGRLPDRGGEADIR